MAVSVERLYQSVKDDDKYEMRCVAGEKGMDKAVNWVHMVEGLAISEFLDGNEIAFTTGIGMPDDNDALLELVESIYKNRASALVINIGPYIKEIPDMVIDFCNYNNFPLFQVPWHVHMAGIMKIFSEILTMADRIDMEITGAMENAIFFHDQQSMYMPMLEKNGIDCELPYCVALFFIEKLEEKESKRDSVENAVKHIVHDYSGTNSKESFVFSKRGMMFVIFKNCSYDEIEKNVKSVVDYFVRLGGIYKDVYCGVGRNTKSVRCLYKSYNLALKAMKLQIRRNVPREAAVYKKMGVYRTLMAIDDMEIVKEYYNELFEPLVRYDELNKTSLVEFLKVYFEESGSAVNTAERMFLHRNTVNYKIHKIEEILNCNLSDFDTKVELYIALKLSELI
ncbi:MAG: PucR family transcriptional regulator [Lachnospira sp.]